MGKAILGTRVGSPFTRLLDHKRKMVNRILPKNKGRWMISVVECHRQNDFGAELEYFSLNGDPSSDSRACGRKLMVEPGSFLSLDSLNGLSGRDCNISFMVGILIEEHGNIKKDDAICFCRISPKRFLDPPCMDLQYFGACVSSTRAQGYHSRALPCIHGACSYSVIRTRLFGEWGCEECHLRDSRSLSA